MLPALVLVPHVNAADDYRPWPKLFKESRLQKEYHWDGRCEETRLTSTRADCEDLGTQDYSKITVTKTTTPPKTQFVACTAAQRRLATDYFAHEGIAEGNLKTIPPPSHKIMGRPVRMPIRLNPGQCVILKNPGTKKQLLVMQNFIVTDAPTPNQETKVLSIMRLGVKNQPEALLVQEPSFRNPDGITNEIDIAHICDLDGTGYGQLIVGIESNGFWYQILKPAHDFSSIEIRDTASEPCMYE